MDIRSTQAARLYQTAQPATQPTERANPAAMQGSPSAEAGSFAAASGAAISDFAATLQRAERVAADAMVGKADPHALVEALSQSELAVQTAVAVRDKVVEAYQEILRMPV
ncbi:MAG: flagellar hook-basal body complex protein FliE [Pseudomonadota bacterium]